MRDVRLPEAPPRAAFGGAGRDLCVIEMMTTCPESVAAQANYQAAAGPACILSPNCVEILMGPLLPKSKNCTILDVSTLEVVHWCVLRMKMNVDLGCPPGLSPEDAVRTVIGFQRSLHLDGTLVSTDQKPRAPGKRGRASDSESLGSTDSARSQNAPEEVNFLQICFHFCRNCS